MKRIYLDNAATSWPKAPDLGEKLCQYIEEGVVNPNRTESSLLFSTFDTTFNLRRQLCNLYDHHNPESIAFTKNVTEAMNWIIKGLFTKEDHIIVSSNEHNSVMRPLVQEGLPFSRIPSDNKGFNDYSNLEALIRSNTKAIIINAAGNVSGAAQDLEIPAEIAKKHNLLFFIDSAQASPFVDISMSNLNLAGIGFTGHKGMLGPEGIGGMVLRKDIALKINPLISGGTGSMSDSESIPSFLPDRLAPGTENMLGLVGLNHSLSYTLKNLHSLRQKEKERTTSLMEGLKEIDGIRLIGADIYDNRTNVVSIQSDKMDEAEIASKLLESGGIETRVGIHCSPSSHKSLHTYPKGTLRFSPGPFTTKDEIDFTLTLLKEILKNA